MWEQQWCLTWERRPEKPIQYSPGSLGMLSLSWDPAVSSEKPKPHRPHAGPLVDSPKQAHLEHQAWVEKTPVQALVFWVLPAECPVPTADPRPVSITKQWLVSTTLSVMQRGHLKQGPRASSKWSKARAVLNYNISWLGLEMPVLPSWSCHPWLLRDRGAAAGLGVRGAWAAAGSGSAPVGVDGGNSRLSHSSSWSKVPHCGASWHRELESLGRKGQMTPAGTWYLSNCRSWPHLCCRHATEEKQGLRHLPKVTEPSTRATGLVTAVSVAVVGRYLFFRNWQNNSNFFLKNEQLRIQQGCIFSELCLKWVCIVIRTYVE